jgi:DNA uptake protein ComE-like DNA-binding protein
VKPPTFFVSARNKRGVLIFIFISLMILFVPRILLFFSSKEIITIEASKIQQLTKNHYNKKFFYKKNRYSKKNQFHLPPQKFDPNSYKEKDWLKLGLSKKQVAVVLKFIKGGIYSNEQLQKIVVIPSELFNLIKDSTFYPEKNSKPIQTVERKLEKEKKHLLFINTATQEELESLPGIGAFFAKNIIKYRDKIGGFCKKTQLLEVWKFDLEKYNAIEGLLFITLQDIRRININNALAADFKAHPYINWNQANALVKMRNQKGGAFRSIEEIKECVLIDEELFDKLKPYLSL